VISADHLRTTLLRQFGSNGNLEQHGFARNRLWTIEFGEDEKAQRNRLWTIEFGTTLLFSYLTITVLSLASELLLMLWGM
jgi:D-hexose-6-phosphate mutarotase